MTARSPDLRICRFANRRICRYVDLHICRSSMLRICGAAHSSILRFGDPPIWRSTDSRIWGNCCLQIGNARVWISLRGPLLGSSRSRIGGPRGRAPGPRGGPLLGPWPPKRHPSTPDPGNAPAGDPPNHTPPDLRTQFPQILESMDR